MSIAVSSQQLMKIWPCFTGFTVRSALTSQYPRRSIGARNNSEPSASSRELHCSHCPQANGDVENLFITALVLASSCNRSRIKWLHQRKSIPAMKRETWVQPTLSYNRLPLLAREEIKTLGSRLSKEKLIGLVDYYDYSYQDSRQAQKFQATHKGLPEVAVPSLQQSLRICRYPARPLKELSRHNQLLLRRTVRLIGYIHHSITTARRTKCIQDIDASLESLFQLYYSLPRKRFLLLSRDNQRKFLDLARHTPKRTEQTTFRFLGLLNDMEQVGVQIPRGIYNHAIYLVGKTLGTVSHKEVESALRQWTSMEVSISGDIQTFNILFDIAIKGQQFALAEMILSEMDERGLKKDRFTRVGLIYYHGIRGNGDAIRQTYRELVEQDLVVDTTVLNCVIASLLRAGEIDAAQQVYGRMKENSRADGGDARWRNLKSKARAKARAKALRNVVLYLNPRDRNLAQQLRQEQDISPDAHTFTVLVSYHVSHTGDFDQISRYIAEMQSFDLSPHGRLFMELFRGFANHGWKSFTLWNRTTLNRVYETFRELANQGINRDVYWDKWAVLWLLRAYVQCWDRRTAIEKWETIKQQWDKAAEHETLMLDVINAAEDKSRGYQKHKLIEISK